MDTRADCGLSEENTQGEGDPDSTMGLEDIAAEAREVEFDWLRSSDPQLQDTAAPQQLPDESPPTVRLHEMCNLKKKYVTKKTHMIIIDYNQREPEIPASVFNYNRL